MSRSERDQREQEHRAEAERLAMLPREDQRRIIAMHRADAANPAIPEADLVRRRSSVYKTAPIHTERY